MTGDERLAKVAEVLARHEFDHSLGECACGWMPTYPESCTPDDPDVELPQHREHQTAAIAPLLEEFRAEDEARALREAADTLWRVFLRLPHTPSPLGDYVQRKSQEFRRAALGAAEPDAGER